MRFLIDQAVSWQVARDLAARGHDAIHVRDVELAEADDRVILARAHGEQRIVVTQDADFGTILAASGHRAPSVIRLRLCDAHPTSHTRVLIANLQLIEEDLLAGAIVVIGDAGIRIRRLPVVK